jgi:hypothetical protein
MLQPLFALVLASTPTVSADTVVLPEFDRAQQVPTEGLQGAPTYERKRDYLMEINIRGRYLTLPDSVIDPWTYDEDDARVPGHLNRPKIRAYSLGLEYVTRNDTANGIFYAEYWGPMVEDGYWDDVEEPPITTDGDYIVFDNFGVWALGGNFAFEVKASPVISFMFGGGLGIAFITGDLLEWNPGSNAIGDPSCTQGNGSLDNPESAPAYERFAAGCGDDGAKEVPRVLPIVDILAAVRFNFSDRATFRLEGGLHDLLYLGGAMGIVF